MPLKPQAKKQGYPVQPPQQQYQPPPMAQSQPGQMPPQQDYAALLDMINRGQMQQLQQSQLPVSRISKDQHTQRGTPGLDQWHRNNPNASTADPGAHYGVIGPDIPTGRFTPSVVPPPAAQAPPTSPAMQNQGQGTGILDRVGAAWRGLIGGGGAEAQNQAQSNIVPDGVPQGQPSSHMLAPDPLAPTGDPNMDPWKAAAGANQAAQAYQQANPQAGQAPPSNGLSYMPVSEGDGFNPGAAPQQPQQAPIPQNPMADVSQTQDGFNEPIQQPNLGGGLGWDALMHTPSMALAPQVAVNAATKNLPGIASNAAQNFSRAQQATATAGDLAQGLKGAGTYAEYAANAAGSPAFNAALKAEGAAGGIANTALRANQLGNTAMKFAGGTGALGTGLRAVGQVAAPLQAGMMGWEAGRLALDPEFRAQQMAQHEALGNQGALAGLGQGLTAPMSTIAGTTGGLYDWLHKLSSNAITADDLQQQQQAVSGRTALVNEMRQQGVSPQEIQKRMAAIRGQSTRS